MGRRATTEWVLMGLDPCPFPHKDKSAHFLGEFCNFFLEIFLLRRPAYNLYYG